MSVGICWEGGRNSKNNCFLILDITKLVQACSSLFKAAQGLFKAVQGVFIPVLPVHRCTGVPLWRCTGVTVLPVRIGVPVYHELLPLTIAINYVHSAVFSPDGQQALTAADDRTAKLWSAESGERLRTFEGHEEYARSAVFSPDGQCGSVLVALW